MRVSGWAALCSLRSVSRAAHSGAVAKKHCCEISYTWSEMKTRNAFFFGVAEGGGKIKGAIRHMRERIGRSRYTP